jgi:PAS domain S-box-containing protein
MFNQSSAKLSTSSIRPSPRTMAIRIRDAPHARIRREANMNFGIKQKMLLVLLGVLALTAALDALLASYYTDRQNQESAFITLSRDLLAWQNDLQALTVRLKGSALSASGDPVLLNQLAELVTLEFNVDDPLRANDALQIARTLSFSKAVSLSRLHLVLRSGGFSSIAVYTGSKLSHYVSASEAGMMVRHRNAHPGWAGVAIKAGENLDFQSWPAWQEGRPPSTIAGAIGTVKQPTVSFSFPSPAFAAIDIAVPVQGVVDEFWRPLQAESVSRIVSELTIAGPAADKDKSASASPWRQATLAVLVYRKRIDRAVLAELAAKTGKWPVLFSPDGSHQQRLTGFNLMPKELLRKAQASAPGTPSRLIEQTVTAEQGSFYAALLPWQFENRTRLILGLTSSRDSTLQNIRQTVSAILIASSLIFVLSIVVGIFWVGRFIDPIVDLTRAVKKIGLKRGLEGEPIAGNPITAEALQPIIIEARDEVGELSAAFNVMIAELRHALETLEQSVQARTAELRQQTRYLRTLIDTLPLWVWLKDTRRRYLATNQANADACGHTVDEMIGKRDQDLWPPELAQRRDADDMEVMASSQRKTVEEAIAGANGIVWMETFRAPVLDEDGSVLGTVGAARNISERKAAEAAREAALTEAVRLARQRSEFLAQMSHELRTPLNAIMGYAQILGRDAHQLSERHATGLLTIQQSGQHLLTLINDILDLARVEAKKLELYPSAIHLSQFLCALAEIIRIKADEKCLSFTYRLAPDLPASVKVDDKRLRQVLLNLLGNAVKFTDRGEISLRVLGAPRAEPGPWKDRAGEATVRLRFEVEDSGIGMSDEQVARIFEPFEQVTEVRRREGGTGLGLAISQQLVHLMGATIQVKSQLGKGSLFWFELELPVAEAGIAALPAQRTAIGYAGARKKVLIVDDAPQNRAMLMDALRPLGFEVFDAGNGQECLDSLSSVKPDLILMDLMMPVMDGREATRTIRNLPEFARIPIVMVSASASRDDESRSYAAGASAFIPKPVEHDILLRIIGEQLSLNWIDDESVPEPAAEWDQQAVDFVIPAADEIEALHQLARLGDMKKIGEQADYLKGLDARYAPFARRLQSLAKNYQSKAIAALVERYRTEHEEAPTENPPA